MLKWLLLIAGLFFLLGGGGLFVWTMTLTGEKTKKSDEDE